MNTSGMIMLVFVIGIMIYTAVKIRQQKIASRITQQLCTIAGVKEVKTIIQAVGYQFEIRIVDDKHGATQKAVEEFMSNNALHVPYIIVRN